MQVTSAVTRSDYMMNSGRPLRTSGQVGSAWRLLPCSVAKGAETLTTNAIFLSFGRYERLVRPSLTRRHPQELEHAGGKSVNVNECPWWTREGKELPVHVKIGPLPPLAKLQRWLSQFCRPEAVA
jgi:hypothetical protein